MLAAALFLLVPSGVPWPRIGIGLVLVPAAFAGAAHGERLWGHDPSRVTIDEVLGCWISCLIAPWTPAGCAAALALFRLFDILKPWPVSHLDRMEGAAGVVLDDVAAGVLAGLCAILGRFLLGLL